MATVVDGPSDPSPSTVGHPGHEDLADRDTVVLTSARLEPPAPDDAEILPLEGRRADGAHPAAVPARHGAVELVLVTAGIVDLVVDGRPSVVPPSSLAWIRPGHEHTMRRRSPSTTGWVARLPPQFLPPQFLPPLFRPTPSLLSGDTPPPSRLPAGEVRWLYGRLDELAAPVPGVERRAGLAYVMVRAWRAGAAGHDPRATASPAVSRAVQLLQGAEPWTVTALARAVGLSAAQLSRTFRAETGQTPTEMRLQRQLDRFLDLSDDDHGLSITDAAYAAGFGSYAQFHRIFVRIMGCSPSAHRARRRSTP